MSLIEVYLNEIIINIIYSGITQLIWKWDYHMTYKGKLTPGWIYIYLNILQETKSCNMWMPIYFLVRPVFSTNVITAEDSLTYFNYSHYIICWLVAIIVCNTFLCTNIEREKEREREREREVERKKKNTCLK